VGDWAVRCWGGFFSDRRRPWLGGCAGEDVITGENQQRERCQQTACAGTRQQIGPAREPNGVDPDDAPSETRIVADNHRHERYADQRDSDGDNLQKKKRVHGELYGEEDMSDADAQHSSS
jgi:hypothetical protein